MTPVPRGGGVPLYAVAADIRPDHTPTWPIAHGPSPIAWCSRNQNLQLLYFTFSFRATRNKWAWLVFLATEAWPTHQQAAPCTPLLTFGPLTSQGIMYTYPLLLRGLHILRIPDASPSLLLPLKLDFPLPCGGRNHLVDFDHPLLTTHPPGRWLSLSFDIRLHDLPLAASFLLGFAPEAPEWVVYHYFSVSSRDRRTARRFSQLEVSPAMDGIFSSPSHRHSRDRHTRDDDSNHNQADKSSAATEQPSISHHRQTIQWPFVRSPNDSESDTSISSFRPLHSTQHTQSRRATWQGNRPNSAGTILDSIVPDYIINYLRGETPESVARRIEERRHPNPEDIAAQLRRTGGFYDSDSPHDQARRAMSPAQLEKAAPNDDGHRARGLRRWIIGWKGGVILNAATGALILLPTVVFFVTALSRHQGGEARLLEGSCELVRRLDFGLHAALNFFVVVVLMGANYAYQVLTSPTRVEVDMAHARKKWLDIGIPSLRNLAFVAKRRAVLATTLLVAGVVTPVMYNAVIITKHFVPAHSILVVAESFLDGAPFSNATTHNGAGLDRSDILALQDSAQQQQQQQQRQQQQPNTLTNLTTADCLDSLRNPVQVEFEAVLLIVDVSPPSSSLLETLAPASALAGRMGPNTLRLPVSPDGYPIQYCLAQLSTAQPTCALDTNDAALGTVTLLILTIIVAGASILASKSFQPLATLGDALSSFLERRDTSTHGACLLTKSEIKQGRWASREARYYSPRTHRWFQTPSAARWILWSLSWVMPTGLAGAALGFSLRNANGGLDNPLNILPSASATPSATTATWTIFLDPAIPVLGLSLLSALPHLLLGILYLSTNALLSTYFLSHELSAYATPFAFLPFRTSAPNPRDAQTTSLFLTLPRPYSWLLLFLFAPFSIFLSASLRPVLTVFSSPTKTTTSTQQQHDYHLPSLVAVPTSILVVLSLLFVILGTVVLLGFRRADSTPAAHADGAPAGNPLVLPNGSCSAVISSRCRRIPGDKDAATGKATWGVIRAATRMEPGLTGFYTSGVERVKVGLKLLQIDGTDECRLDLLHTFVTEPKAGEKGLKK
ncbi:hypothetical protein SODALDRAFT_376843 [Sodiomyces alkalinus F11]|uniref:DUF6536 domain-containing protein n=1 Tax=Sodiomyces alkalinus (strain CBS 110278 / VKM F-3762 / F11) TaxID=1314773 RepID=A0A3N2Q2Y7_SODAK|nr:hypothetical protein SODALDRAFT_376843 [Sodiomyces alkalinus F11]ROT41134.1 hypothetical protein SODALDRAFT_376843 [Sodiomyces alkalinus F11]